MDIYWSQWFKWDDVTACEEVWTHFISEKENSAIRRTSDDDFQKRKFIRQPRPYKFPCGSFSGLCNFKGLICLINFLFENRLCLSQTMSSGAHYCKTFFDDETKICPKLYYSRYEEADAKKTEYGKFQTFSLLKSRKVSSIRLSVILKLFGKL